MLSILRFRFILVFSLLSFFDGLEMEEKTIMVFMLHEATRSTPPPLPPPLSLGLDTGPSRCYL